jgi:hypothetical protein
MTPEEIAAIIEQHKYPTLHAGDTGINIITLQIWLGMLGFYTGPISGLLDAATAQAVDRFRAQQLAAGIALQAPAGAVVDSDTWEAMDNLLQQRLPPDPDTFDRLPLPRRSSYDSDDKYRKALYEGLRAFGFPVAPAAQPLRLPVVINDSGVAILHGIPPGAYTLELGDAGSPDWGSAEIDLVDGEGAPVSGQIRLVRDGAERSVTVAGGHALVNGIQQGDYHVVMERVDEEDQIVTSTGSVEIRIFDANNQAVSGMATLVGVTGDGASLQQAVRLFQALSRQITSGLEPDDRSGLRRNILTGELAETAHQHHELVWESFEHTWGRFHGAPWMGVVFHSLEDGEAGREQDELHWGERDTIAMLHEWGRAYLRSAQDEADLEERLRRPVAIRYIARPLGGKIDGRSDFSQVGTEASLHLPRKSEKIVGGVATGQTYGGVDYDSPEYDTSHMENQIVSFALLDSEFCSRCPDHTIVDRFLPRDLQVLQSALIGDRFARSRSINCSIRRWWRTQWSPPSTDKAKYERSFLAPPVPPSKAAVFSSENKDRIVLCDERLYDTNEITAILGHSEFADRPDLAESGQRDIGLFAMLYIKKIQKYLWICRLLIRTNWLEKARNFVGKLIQDGYDGLFEEYARVLQGNDPKEIAKLAFAFDETDWENPWQLEALVEFYLNYSDPWASPGPPSGAPRKPSSYKSGKNRPLLPEEENGYFRVGPKMRKGLHFVLVDPFGSRLSGDRASMVESSNADVQLYASPQAVSPQTDDEFHRINDKFDTIYFPDAEGRKIYRIIKKDVVNYHVTLETLGETTSGIRGRWQIPAGVGGMFDVDYLLPPTRPKKRQNYDHYDGLLFVLKDGLVKGKFRFGSYTSYAYAPSGKSVRGNRAYGFSSARAGGDGRTANHVPQVINYAFALNTPGRDAALAYFSPNVTEGPISESFMHWGPGGLEDPVRDWSGSAGCLESPEFTALRERVLDLFPATTILELSDTWKKKWTVSRLSAALRQKCDKKNLDKCRVKLWASVWTDLGEKDKATTKKKAQWDFQELRARGRAPAWTDALDGTLWLIRPDELPKGRR